MESEVRGHASSRSAPLRASGTQGFGAAGAVCIATLGCKVNQADSDALAHALLQRGYHIARPGERASVCVVNTCTVTHVADAKARKLIRRLARDHPQSPVVVTGCGAERIAAGLAPTCDVARVVPNAVKDELPHVIEQLIGLPKASRSLSERDEAGGPPHADQRDSFTSAGGPRPARPASVRAFVKVQDGCDHRCAYCIVPEVRGPMRSRPTNEVIAEMHDLVAAGARELVICGIRLGAYGERSDGSGLARLLEAAAQVPVARLRLSSIEPWEVGDHLIGVMAAHPRLCPHLHLPLQSGDDDVLRAMGRPYSLDDYRAVIGRLREAAPDLAVTTDVMVGFPGESAAAFECTCQAVAALGFARAHVFRYSRRPGTRAAGMPNHVPPQDQARRAAGLAQVARAAACGFARRFIGRTAPVLFEEWDAGVCAGLTDTYLVVHAPGDPSLVGQVAGVELVRVETSGIAGRVVARSAMPGGCAARAAL